MTLAQRQAAFVEKWGLDGTGWYTPGTIGNEAMGIDLYALLQQDVAEEREACAKVAENCYGQFDPEAVASKAAKHIADKIRARRETSQ